MGTVDRLVIPGVIAGLYFGYVISGTPGIVLLAPAGVFVLTSRVSFCPLHTLVGLSTCSKEK